MRLSAPIAGLGNRPRSAGGPRRGFSATAKLISRTPADAERLRGMVHWEEIDGGEKDSQSVGRGGLASVPRRRVTTV